MTIDYDGTAAEYEASLVTKLRGHGAGSFLELWVPDPDPALGIFNMIEAAWTDGRDVFDLTVSRATLSVSVLERLKHVAAPIADIRIEETLQGYALFVKRISGAGDTRRAARVSTAQKVQRRSRAPEAEQEVAWDVHPSLLPALEAETAEFPHEGKPSGLPGCIEVSAPSEGGAVGLVVDERDGLIRQARHWGVKHPLRRRLLELMCRIIEARTVQDATDHAAINAIHRLRSKTGVRPTTGILLPANAGSQATEALRMVRDACKAYQARSGKGNTENLFEPPPGAAWSGADPGEKLLRAVSATERLCAREGLPANTMRPVRIEKDINRHDIRVIVHVSDKLSAGRVPVTLRRLERFLKEELEPALQVYLEPWKDQNVLRRL